MISTVLVLDGPDLAHLERSDPDVYGCNISSENDSALRPCWRLTPRHVPSRERT